MEITLDKYTFTNVNKNYLMYSLHMTTIIVSFVNKLLPWSTG